MDCLIPNCQNDCLTDYPVCDHHAMTIHFTARNCRCRSCATVAEIVRVFSDEPGLAADILDELPRAA